jgi:hypothetical protein
MPGAYGTWHGTAPATGYRSSLLVVVARFLQQHFLFGTPSIADSHRPSIALSIALSLCSSQLHQVHITGSRFGTL